MGLAYPVAQKDPVLTRLQYLHNPGSKISHLCSQYLALACLISSCIFNFHHFIPCLVGSIALMFLYGLGLCYRTQQIQQLSSLFLVYKLQILAIALMLQWLLITCP